MQTQEIPQQVAIDGQSITIDGVSKDYGRGELAVRYMYLKIEAGEFFSIIGSSGSGKSTTLKMLSGLEFPTSGHIYLGDEEITNLPANKRDVHTVFQNYALFPHMTVEENVAYGLKGKKVADKEISKRVREMLDLVEMLPLSNAKPTDLSGGQQQRVALARSLVLRPKALLLDEPLGALDMKLRHHMQDVIRSIHQEVGTTFVYVTHDQEEAFSMSDRVAVMDKGELKQVATPEELYAHPASRFVADFVGNANIVPGRIEVVEGPNAYRVSYGALGTYSCPGVANLHVGDEVCAVLRPQDIWLTALEGDNIVRASGSVANRAFYGSFARLTFNANGTALQCMLTGNGNTGLGKSTVDANWRAQDMWVVRAKELGE